MQEFMILIRDVDNHHANLSPEQQQKHVQEIAAYIKSMMDKGQLLGAQPLSSEGMILSNNNGTITDGPYAESKEVITGYFHIKAENLEEARKIGAANPILLLNPQSRVEVRPILKMAGIN